MKQQEVHNYVRRYFVANDSRVLEETPAYLKVQLSVDLDKELMNRPFYWHYLEKTGGVPNPMALTLVTDANNAPEDVKGEPLHFGSPRLRQIFNSAQSLGSFIRLYEHVQWPPDSKQSSQPFHPWLCLNANVSFQCDRKKDVILSLGLNLIHGQIVPNFYEQVIKKPLTPKIPDYCFTLSPLIKVESGILRLQKMIRTFAENEPDDWAMEAVERWNTDLALLEAFYENQEQKPKSYESEKQALQEQYEPHIEVKLINGGIFYLQQQVFKQ
ncbi:YqhG family protein [Shouchella shacheensis]|uniref:YqhG family protein n=1 Tax=Shouchella shacheensis TaxID=1649580 RepID=UPI00073FB286|nr:YqhG family protein [Shouchella shacheensis]